MLLTLRNHTDMQLAVMLKWGVFTTHTFTLPANPAKFMTSAPAVSVKVPFFHAAHQEFVIYVRDVDNPAMPALVLPWLLTTGNNITFSCPYPGYYNCPVQKLSVAAQII